MPRNVRNSRTGHPPRRRRRVRRPRLRRRRRRPHRPARRRQQGDDLLPLPQQGAPLPRDRPRHVHRRQQPAPAPSPPAASPPPTRLDAFIDAIVAEARAPAAPPADDDARDRRGRPAPRPRHAPASWSASSRTCGRSSTRASGRGAFRRVDPVLMYFTLVGPIVDVPRPAPRCGMPIGRLAGSRGRTASIAAAFSRHLDGVRRRRARSADHLKAAARRALEPGATTGPGPDRHHGSATTGRRRPAGRSGEQA